jgi:hypothetical protein
MVACNGFFPVLESRDETAEPEDRVIRGELAEKRDASAQVSRESG